MEMNEQKMKSEKSVLINACRFLAQMLQKCAIPVYNQSHLRYNTANIVQNVCIMNVLHVF